MTEIFKQLSAPFSPDLVSWRVGSMSKDKSKGMALAYIDARDVMRRLDDVCGPAGWQARYPHANGKTICEIGIKSGDEWIWKANGAGDTDIEAEKGAISDAFKRAAVMWGIGRYLYDLPSPWVEVNEYKQIKENEFAKLRSVLSRASGSSPNPAPSSRASSPTAESPAAVGGELTIEATKPPRGIDADLWATVVSRASGGIEALGAYWNNDLTTSEKTILALHKEALKAFAANIKRAA